MPCPVKTLQRFQFGCIPARLLIAWLVWEFQTVRMFLIVPALVMFLLWLFPNQRTKGVFGQPAWWSDFRLLHACLYALAAYYSYDNDDGSLPAAIILADTLLAMYIMYLRCN